MGGHTLTGRDRHRAAGGVDGALTLALWDIRLELVAVAFVQGSSTLSMPVA